MAVTAAIFSVRALTLTVSSPANGQAALTLHTGSGKGGNRHRVAKPVLIQSANEMQSTFGEQRLVQVFDAKPLDSPEFSASPPSLPKGHAILPGFEASAYRPSLPPDSHLPVVDAMGDPVALDSGEAPVAEAHRRTLRQSGGRFPWLASRPVDHAKSAARRLARLWLELQLVEIGTLTSARWFAT